MQNAPEVRITGSGLVTCLGASRRATLAAIEAGGRVRGEPFSFLADTPYGGYLSAQGQEPDLSGCTVDRRMRKFMSRHAELAAVAAREALEEADLPARGIAPERIGLYAGVGLAAIDITISTKLLRASLDEGGSFSLDCFSRNGLRTIHPLWSFHTLANMPACIVSVLEGIKGDNGIYTPWEDQTAFALLEAAHALHGGAIDAAVVVASDTPSHPASMVEIASSGFITPEEIAAPGAACLVLERPDSSAPARPFSRLSKLHLIASPQEDARPSDPLAPIIGRTLAAAPLLLTILGPLLDLPCRLHGCGGHDFSFEAA
jgi:3-oxoacyl-(acyl-carrier-protein) synthase